LAGNTSGDDNTAIGWHALLIQSATGNTAIGAEAGESYDNGNNNTFIGRQADGNAAAFTNSTVVGYNGTVTASNQVRIGNSSVTLIGGYEPWSNISDGRYKKNIREDVSGLDFILQLRPVTYNLDIDGINEMLYADREQQVSDENRIAIEHKKAIRKTGFVAQEVETAALHAGYDFSGVDAPKNDKDFYGLRYAEFVVPLVKAVQEQQAMIEVLLTTVEEQRVLLNRLQMELQAEKAD